MSFSLPSLRGLASRLLTRPTTAAPTPCLSPPTTRLLSTTPSLPKGASGFNSGNKPPKQGKPGKPGSKTASGNKNKPGTRRRGDDQPRDPKMINMLSHLAILSPNRIPPPLRMGRNRHLRHWTIHRAWLLFRRREREARTRVLMRQHQSMNSACEELRLSSGPGSRGEGYLFRVAMEKKGLYGLNGVPIEYARAQTETPAREAWNHEWKR